MRVGFRVRAGRVGREGNRNRGGRRVGLARGAGGWRWILTSAGN